jgi:hypothetical protein
VRASKGIERRKKGKRGMALGGKWKGKKITKAWQCGKESERKTTRRNRGRGEKWKEGGEWMEGETMKRRKD